MSTLPSSSYSFHQRRFHYDIFLSFSGKDTRKGFTSHLSKALTWREIKTFRDDKSLRRGKEFAPELLSAMRESWGSIIVFSPKYAFSRWCLDELVEIMKQRKEMGHKIYPIFYHVEPSDLEHQRNVVQEAFDKHERIHNEEKTQGWREALKEVAGISGWTLTMDQDESDMIEDVVKKLKLAKLDAEINIQGEIEKLKDELLEIHALIGDAEERQLRDQSVKIWLTTLQNMAYDVEEIVDEFETDIGSCKLMMERQDSSIKKPRLMGFDSYNNDIWSKINEVNGKLKILKPQKNQLQLRMTEGQSSTRTEQRQQLTSMQTETQVFGRDKDKEAIIDSLFRRDNEANFVISIVGMAGIGKTTLAQLIYNDARVKNHFDLQAWVSVPNEFDVARITKEILQAINSVPYCTNLDSLQEGLRNKLLKKRFLIVMDNVRNEKYQNWNILQSPFLTKISGSKIILTTRDLSVSSSLGASHSHALEVLSDDDSLSVFAQHALGATDFSDHPDLKEVAEKIVKKCNGLPLAAKTLSGLLQTNVDLDAWKDILESEIWNLVEHQCGIIPALQLSYNNLPPHLKRCFAYCSIFPKGYEFLEEEIILLWSAQGFLLGKQCALDIGRKYFRDLLSRFLLQKSNKDSSRFVMHDLINDLAQSVAGEICCRMEGDKQISKHTRHLSYMDREYNDITKFKGIREATHLRTFLPLPLLSSHDPDYLLSNNVIDFLPNLRCLRVLSLHGYAIRLLSFIGDLKHLRYLNFSQTDLESLPGSIATLYNLETLLLEGCRKLQKLPSNMENLVNLHHLNLIGAERLKGMPSNFGALTGLRSLSNFVVGKCKGHRIRELKDLSILKGQLCISGLENVVETDDALNANIHDKLGLDKLELKWSEDSKARTGEVEKNVLDSLQPSKMLKELIIMNYCGAVLPNWLGDSSLNGLLSLCLNNCPNCLSLPSIGRLPLLEKLQIKGLRSVTSVGVEFFGENTKNPFPSLESLEFQDMPQWKNWNFCEVDEEARKFPRLRELRIENCPELSWSLPEHLPSLEKLVIGNFEKLEISIQSLPRLSKLMIAACHEVVFKGFEDHSSLQGGISKLSTTFHELTWLTKLELWSCSNLISLTRNNLSLNVEILEISECENLKFLLEEGESSNMVSNACAIEKLHIIECPSLVSLSSRGELPTGLKELKLEDCKSLVSLSSGVELPTSACAIEKLHIFECPSLVSLSSSGELPTGLKELKLEDCKSLVSLSSRGVLPTSLKELKIRVCPQLESVAQEIQHDSSLESIKIDLCDKIKYLPQGLSKLSHLRRIRICRCPNLVCFPESGLPNTSPEDSFPSLRNLSISGSNIYKSLTEWGFHRLTCLQSLKIFGADVDALSFPPEEMGMKLPSSLTTLYIGNFPKLETLSSSGFQNLTSLMSLRIQNCPNLKYLPAKDSLSSLLFFSYFYSPGKRSKLEMSNVAHVPCLENKMRICNTEPGAAINKRYRQKEGDYSLRRFVYLLAKEERELSQLSSTEVIANCIMLVICSSPLGVSVVIVLQQRIYQTMLLYDP